MKHKEGITQEELERAIRKFLENGGRIDRLPDQKNIASRMIGGKWNTSELAGDLAN